ncbi:DUF4381 domain-containing protein [Vibrio sp. JC009]|uniref:DUF4381 domain-containing protein n=1 Tax=Vibrio sp. JC009 TaxID=2912314 RepID=UPI0023B040B7|nr:DUF4381 domain-containing protein [Vibrio sp. JC009]WED23829.1 DUF4381 domain-containing protein [Vibrio sp. JC009]
MTQETTTQSHPLPLEALQLPEPPGFWPFAWGWWSLIGTVMLSVGLIYLLIRWQKKRHAPKKAAIALLTLEKNTITPSGAMEIVRQAVLSYYSRAKVAHLSGTSWLAFLDTQVKDPIFAENADDWIAALYEKSPEYDREYLIQQCDKWLHDALPPKRRER